ncbi:hypothetical protein [Methylorubrum sp. DB1722]|uniref:hypothetical protein n=1 Tax=Methylorubrum sp. DB1722 TaxID=2478916 RepID=UPI0028169867|nr:hypothetical protein [Methylorubrum sp. DB1722]
MQDRRDAERDRRIARARAEARPTVQAVVAEADRTGNGGPPMLAAVAEVRAIGELLYGRRFTQEMAEALGEDPRQLRRWLSGEAAVPDRAVRWAREAARRRAKEILALVGEA